MSIERRRSPRKTLADLAFINLEPDNGGIVVDVSEDGLGFHSAVPVEISGPVKFWFSIRSIDRIDASGIVAWTDESKKSGGIKFVELNDDVRARIRTWLANAAEHPAASSAAGRTNSGAVTPGSPAETAGESVSRTASSDPAIFGSVRRKPPVAPPVAPPPISAAPVGAPPDPPSSSRPAHPPVETKPPVSPGFAGSRSASLIATPGSETTRPSILTSPLSLLATEPAAQSPYSQDFGAYGQYRDSGLSEPAPRDRAALPMVVVILAAVAVTVAGYYTLRWKNQPRPAAIHQAAQPVEASAEPSAQPTTTIPEQPASSAATPAQPGSLSVSTPDQGGVQPLTTSQSPASAQPPASEPVSTETVPATSPTISTSKESANPPDSATVIAPAAEVNSPELEEARALLRGSTGRRESARAAQLLWTAVGNGSVAAEVELARLYIAGDGVKKSCEQARVLLRAAMGRGSQDATQQLAALARSGCTK